MPKARRTHGADGAAVNRGVEPNAGKAWHEAHGIGFLALSGICLFPAWVAVLSGSFSKSLTAVIVIAGVVGCISFFWGITQLTLSRGKEIDLGVLETDEPVKSQEPAKIPTDPPEENPRERETG